MHKVTLVKQIPQEPSFDEPLSIGLTPSEITNAFVVNFESSCTSFSSMINANDVVLDHKSTNERTGNTCQITAFEFEDALETLTRAYHVEIKVGNAFIIVIWQDNTGSRAELDYIKKSAHQTYINLCMLIGINVGLGFQANPSLY